MADPKKKILDQGKRFVLYASDFRNLRGKSADPQLKEALKLLARMGEDIHQLVVLLAGS